MNYVFLCFLSFLSFSCVGYRFGGTKPPSLTEVKTISIPMFANDTMEPRAEALATSAVANAFTQDGTYRIVGSDKADAMLEGRIGTINYTTLRSSRIDALLAEELNNQVTIHWVLKDAKDPTKVLASGSSLGQSRFFADSNFQTARRNALPDALARAGQNLVSRLSSGY
jgi:membrane peptidoglycan carboxypeptidase